MINHLIIEHLTIKHFNCTNWISTYNSNILLYTTIKYKNRILLTKTLQKEILQQNIINKSISNKDFKYKAMLKAFKRVFNHRLYLCTTKGLFCFIPILERFKMRTNKIFRLIINRVALEIVLISSFGWNDVITKKIGLKIP